MTPPGRSRGAGRVPRGRSDDRGSGVVELPVMAVFFFAPLLALAIFVGRVHAGYSAVESAARHAARTISIARDPTEAAGVAEADAATTVRVGSARCRDMSFTHAVTAEQVTVTVSCTVDLSEASLIPVIPGVRSVASTAVEPRDRHRESTG
jgi:Flp pilus assembly protein TadG